MSNLVDMKKIIDEAFTQYSGAVLQSRALVDVRDCLKPSARQIFYCLYTDKMIHSKPYQKTLKLIGSLARMYIHGDSSALGVLMRAGQEFAMRYPLLDIKGNNGNLIESGNWAAPRYTDSRLSALTSDIFEDVTKDTIEDWRDNYDDTEKYPAVLPSKGFYNIVNGTMGIGIGMASSIPQFNLNDVNKALEILLLNPNCNFDDIYCPPDFATGAYLLNETEVKEALKNGTGASCRLRSKIKYDEKDNCLIVTEIPYSVYTNTICGELEAIMESPDNPGIDRFNDLTGNDPNIKIYLNKGVNIKKVEQYLYKNTSLQSYYGINMTMLEDGRFPRVFTWKEALQAHIDHEKIVYRRGFEYDLKKIEHRIHIIDGLLICLASIDEVITTIKSANSTADANNKLVEKFLLDAEQAKAVLDMKLSRLAKLEVQKLTDEKSELEIEKNKLLDILNNEDKFNNELISGWRNIAAKYGDDHRTKMMVIEEKEEAEEAALPNPENCVVIITRNGGIKRVSAAKYKPQKRNGKGIKSEDDAILETISTNTIDTLMLFSSLGKMYRLLVDEIPESDKYYPVSGLIDTVNGETIVAITSLYRKSSAKFVMFITKQGMIKKTALEEYTKGRTGGKGVAAIKLKDGDTLANVTFAENEDFIVVTKNSYAIRFETKDIAPIGRVAAGVKAIKLTEGDEVIVGLPVHKETDTLAVFSKDGMAKRTELSEYPVQGRGGKGLLTYKGAELIGASLVSKDDSILIIGSPSSICILANDIPVLGRTTAGNIMVKSRVKKIVKL